MNKREAGVRERMKEQTNKQEGRNGKGEKVLGQE